MSGLSRLLFLACLSLSLLLSVSVNAQIPIPMEEQIAVFNSLSPSQRQALIRELQSQLPPAQREAIIGMLMDRQGEPSSPTPDSEIDDEDINRLAGEIAEASEDSASSVPRLSANDVVVIEIELPEMRSGTLTVAEVLEREEFLERLRNGNPYRLDSAGRLQMPGVPTIELAGLNVEQAEIRIGAEQDLRPFEFKLTLLPLEPIGIAALKPFAYDLFRRSASGFDPVVDVPVPNDYVIGPGDSINVQLFGNQNTEYFLEVGRDGTVNFPELGPLSVAGLEFNAVRELITERVNEQLIGVRASTTLGELRSIRVWVFGEVMRPGSFTVSSLATMTSALYASGGITEIGSLRQISLVRNGESVSVLDLYDLRLNGDTSNDSELQPGDVILVPPVGSTISVVGDVRRPAIYELRGEQTVRQLISLAGGLLPSADANELRLERIVPGRGISVIDLGEALSDGLDTVLQDGDVLRITPGLDQLEGSVNLVGNVYREGIYQWNEGLTVSELIPSSEFVKPQSDLNYVLIRRETRPNMGLDLLSVDLEGVWERRPGSVDLVLQPRDTVYVLQRETGRQQHVPPILERLRGDAQLTEPLPIVRVGGQVRAPGEYPLEPAMRVSDVLRAGGGLKDAAYAAEAELTRYAVIDGQFRETELIAVDLEEILAGNDSLDLLVAPYDYLNIKQISRWGEQEEVSLEGEFVFPGAYPIRPGERLSSVIERAGGLTEFAFIEGSVFTRVGLLETEREQLETLARRIEADLAALSLSDPNSDALAVGESLLGDLRNAEATGRLVIQLDDVINGRPEADVILQGGDRLIVPETRQEVTVIGEVQYRTSHTFDSSLELEDYLNRSGGLTRRADSKRIYVVRANGGVVIDSGNRWFRRGEGIEIRPGDTIVAPLDVVRVRPLTLWTNISQIIYNTAIAAAAVNSF